MFSTWELVGENMSIQVLHLEKDYIRVLEGTYAS